MASGTLTHMLRSWVLCMILLFPYHPMATLCPPMGRSTWIETSTHTTVSPVPPVSHSTITTTRFHFHRRVTHTTGHVTILRIRTPQTTLPSPLVGVTLVFGLSKKGHMTHIHLSAAHAQRLPPSLHSIGDRIMQEWNTRWELSQHPTPGSFWTTIRPMQTPQGVPMDQYTVWVVAPPPSPLHVQAFHHTNAPELVRLVQTHYPRFPYPPSFPTIAPITPEFTVSGNQHVYYDPNGMLRQETSQQTFSQTQLDGQVIASLSETKRVTWRRIQ